MMNLFHGSIRKKLLILVFFATLPVFFVLLGTELVNREKAAEIAQKDAALFVNGFAEIQRRITNSTHTLLRTVASIPDLANLDVEKSRVVLATLLDTNPIYTNVILVDLKGNVVAAGRGHEQARNLNFGDRKQFQQAIATRGFASGEFVVGKSTNKPIFPFGMAVLNQSGEPAGAIIVGVSLAHYGQLLERGSYPENSFFGLCDHQGIRLFRYPLSAKTGIGKPIKKEVFDAAVSSGNKGHLLAFSSDGKKRITAFESLRLEDHDSSPYMYMFMGFDYEQVNKRADAILLRLAVSSILSLVLALVIAWFIGGRSIARRIENLSVATKKFGQGDEHVASHIDYSDGEIGELARSFDSMVTIIRQREEEKRRLESQLNQAQKMDAIGQLAGGVAHDFNNMLGGILGAGELLSRRLADDPKTQQLCQIIIQSATRATDLTRKLLAFSRTSNRAFSILSIEDIIEETITILKNTTDRRIRIETDFKASTSTISGDASQLQSVFLNLGINACHAMPEGGTLTLATRDAEVVEAFCYKPAFDLKPGQYLEIEVKDTGCGIPPENLDKIFEPFFTTKEQGKGTGLGLAAVYGTLKQHEGSITVSSEQALGTSFRILLPVARETEKVEARPQDLLKGEGTVLIVDDEEGMRIATKGLLEDLGYSVIMAGNGEEAITLFKQYRQSVDLVILDMIMPVMNGKDCFIALQQLNPRIPVLLSSGFTNKEDVEELKKRGLKGVLPKPCPESLLSKAVHDALLELNDISSRSQS